MSRERMLAKVRAALGRQPGQPVPPIPEARIHIPGTDLEESLTRMQAAIERLAGKFYRAASSEDACRYVAERLNGADAVASHAPFLADCGVTALPNVHAGWADPAALRDACARMPFGITCADWALADTATVVVLTSPEEARLPSLLPPCHLVLIPQERILSSLDELLAREPIPVDARSAMVLITGPSRSGDIEQILVRGVHGPGEIHLVVVPRRAGYNLDHESA